MNNFQVWDVYSYVWTEIGLGDDEFISYAGKLRIAHLDWRDIDRILFRDVCLSFSLESAMPLAVLFPPMILLIGISPWPDWGYETAYLNARMHKWYSKPYWRYLINPIRLIGYPLSVLFILNYRRKLKKAYLNSHVG